MKKFNSTIKPKPCKHCGKFHDLGKCRVKVYSKPVRKRAKIKPVSDKQRKMNAEYREAKKRSLEKKFGSVPADGEKVPCEIQSPKCTGWSESTHHSKGRGTRIADEDTLFHGCMACHNYVEHNAEGIAWAKENGFVKLRV